MNARVEPHQQLGQRTLERWEAGGIPTKRGRKSRDAQVAQLAELYDTTPAELLNGKVA